jgi:hypothetical protein
VARNRTGDRASGKEAGGMLLQLPNGFGMGDGGWDQIDRNWKLSDEAGIFPVWDRSVKEFNWRDGRHVDDKRKEGVQKENLESLLQDLGANRLLTGDLRSAPHESGTAMIREGRGVIEKSRDEGRKWRGERWGGSTHTQENREGEKGKGEGEET